MASNPPDIPLYPGEKVDSDICGREVVYMCPFNKDIVGHFYLTNYKIYFKSGDSNKPKVISVPLCTLNKIEKFGGVKTKGENAYGILIICKDIRTLRFAHKPENHSRRDVFEKLKSYAFPLSHSSNLKLFCFEAKLKYDVDNGWSVYDPIAEFKRMCLPNESWRITKVNDRYKLCDTYPSILVVPQAASDEDLNSVAAFRSRARLPVLSWINPQTQASITRCSQPLSGINGNRSIDDEKYIQLIMDANAQSDKIYIMDARPQINAQANRGRGGGLENDDFYSYADIQFLNIFSIHVMRESLRKLTELCYPVNMANADNYDDSHFYDDLEASKWLVHIQLVISGAVRIVDKIEYQKTSVVVHCSDGWDRTAQLTSLSMIMLDPYYRTLKGFQVLIDKEWLSFGHKFAQRIGHGEDKASDDNRSPIFLQWLDCVWQLTRQFPNSFEFNEFLLITIADHLYSCLFGTFLCNTEAQRRQEGVTSKTKSLWSMINSNHEAFLNPLYTEALNPNNISVASSQPTDYILLPRCSEPFIQLWTSYYCRWNLRIAPQSVEQIQLRNQELLKMRKAIQQKVDELQNKLKNKFSTANNNNNQHSISASNNSSIPGQSGNVQMANSNIHNVVSGNPGTNVPRFQLQL